MIWPPLSVRAWIGMMTLAAAILLGLILGLSAIAEPSHSATRLADVQARFDTARRAAWTAGDLRRYPDHAICADVRTVEGQVRPQVEAAAARAGIALGAVQIGALAGGPQPMIGVAGIGLAAHGQEAGLRVFLRTLAGGSPMLLADGVDLSSDGGGTTLKFKGRVLCHDRRLP